METKSDKSKEEGVEQRSRLKAIRCAHCQKLVAYRLKDCPWCGSSLAFGWLEDG